MRRKLKVKADHKEYSERTIVRYAWVPTKLDDNYQVWLEKYYVNQKYYIFNCKGEWLKKSTWSESTEKRKFLKSIKDSDKNVQNGMDTQKYTRAIQAAGRALRKTNSTY